MKQEFVEDFADDKHTDPLAQNHYDFDFETIDKNASPTILVQAFRDVDPEQRKALAEALVRILQWMSAGKPIKRGRDREIPQAGGCGHRRAHIIPQVNTDMRSDSAMFDAVRPASSADRKTRPFERISVGICGSNQRRP